MAWQAIDTAPRDGTAVDLWMMEQSASYRVADCWYSQGQWLASDSFLGQPVESFPHIVATHWMQAPAGPLGAAESGAYAWKGRAVSFSQKIGLKSSKTHTGVN